MIQEVVWSVSIVLMGALAALFAWVAVGAGDQLADYGPVVASAYRARTWLFGLAIIVLIGVNYETLGKLPYVSSMAAPAATWRIATTANVSTLAALLKTFGVVVIPDGLGGFTHTSAVYVVDAQGRLARVLDPDSPPQLFAAALRTATP